MYDLNDCTMLSGETGNGKFPVESVKIMADICRHTEENMNYEELYKAKMGKTLANNLVNLAYQENSTFIVVLDNNSKIAKEISGFKVNPFVIYPSSNKEALRNLSLYFGVEGVYSEMKSKKQILEDVHKFLQRRGVKQPGKLVVYDNIFDKDTKVI